ncbi:thioredoxin domain-containing protein [Pseudomonas sp. 2FE]|uniref:DsbA family protein n=1 Tax=Pseudomonas sp. 2FE TaxID=2502190 RepID=UPI0010F7862F|nr:thioredoxin domain-containing protein [Pseudomonas sp. 2FE]
MNESTFSIKGAVAIAALATALGVVSYKYFTVVPDLEAELNAIQKELVIAQAQGLDTGTIEELVSKINPAEGKDIPASPDNWVYGNQAARYTLIEMTDTECPYCRDHFPQVKGLIESSAGQINAAILHVPALSEASRRQSVAIECAGEQGGSDAAWKFTEVVFDKTGGHGKGVSESLVSLASSLGLDGKRFAACTDSKAAIDRVAGDLDQALKIGIQQTPSTLVLDNTTGLSMVLQGANASQDGILKAIASLGKQQGASK